MKWPFWLRTCVRFIRVAASTLKVWELRARGVQVGRNCRVTGSVLVTSSPNTVISLGDRVVCNSKASKNTLEARGAIILKVAHPNAMIVVGDDVGMTSCTISARTKIAIGARTLIGAGVLITDSDHHPVDAAPEVPRRFAEPPLPHERDRVSIGEDVFLGARSIVLKGVSIGDGSVIGAGSVVSSDVPAGVVAAGNPCRVVRNLRVHR